MDEVEILKMVCLRLEEASIPYMLTGSMASNLYAVPRMTRDIDIVAEILISDCDKLMQIFQNDFYVSRSSITEAIRHESMFNIIHNESIYKVDFIIRKEASYRQIEFQRKKKCLFHGIPIWIVSPEDLIISKLCWAKDSNSALQINDVQNLLENLLNLDQNYIDEWVEKFKLQSVYDKVRKHA